MSPASSNREEGHRGSDRSTPDHHLICQVAIIQPPQVDTCERQAPRACLGVGPGKLCFYGSLATCYLQKCIVLSLDSLDVVPCRSQHTCMALDPQKCISLDILDTVASYNSRPAQCPPVSALRKQGPRLVSKSIQIPSWSDVDLKQTITNHNTSTVLLLLLGLSISHSSPHARWHLPGASLAPHALRLAKSHVHRSQSGTFFRRRSAAFRGRSERTGETDRVQSQAVWNAHKAKISLMPFQQHWNIIQQHWKKPRFSELRNLDPNRS